MTTTSRRLPPSPTGVVVSEPPKPPANKLALADLAADLHTTVPRLWMLIQHGYLRLADKTESCFTTTVEHPGQGALDWLRGMLAPLRMRPMLPLSVAARLLKITTQEARAFCLEANVVFQLDPVFGEVITLTGYRDLGRALFCARRPLSFDRQTFLETFSWMLDFSPHRRRLPRAKRIEQEIRRIAAMKEPARSIRAVEFYAAYSDARVVADACAGRNPGEQLASLDRQVRRMGKFVRSQTPWGVLRKKRHPQSRLARALFPRNPIDGSFIPLHVSSPPPDTARLGPQPEPQ